MRKIFQKNREIGQNGRNMQIMDQVQENSRKNWQTSVYYMDIVSELEKMGDFMINVSQALYKLQR